MPVPSWGPKPARVMVALGSPWWHWDSQPCQPMGILEFLHSCQPPARVPSCAISPWPNRGPPQALPAPWMQVGLQPCPLSPLCPGLTPVLRGLEDAVRQDDGCLQVWEFLPPQRLVPWQTGTRKAALVQPHHRHHCGTMSPMARHGTASTNPESHRPQHPPTPGHTDPSTHSSQGTPSPDTPTPAPTSPGTHCPGGTQTLAPTDHRAHQPLHSLILGHTKRGTNQLQHPPILGDPHLSTHQPWHP